MVVRESENDESEAPPHFLKPLTQIDRRLCLSPLLDTTKMTTDIHIVSGSEFPGTCIEQYVRAVNNSDVNQSLDILKDAEVTVSRRSQKCLASTENNENCRFRFLTGSRHSRP